MSNKNKIVILVTLVLSFTLSLEAFSEGDTTDVSTNKAESINAGINEKEIGIGWAVNIKYKYPVVNFKYYTRRIIWKDRIRLRFDYEGYRITKYVFPEYERLLVQADYRIGLKIKNNYEHCILPKAGFALIFDFYDEPSPTKWFSTAPNIGIDYEGRIKKFQLHLKNTISFFSDGLWYELNPGISYKIYKNIYLKTRMNIIMAYTYNGNFAIGLFPGVSINIFPV